MATLGNLDGVHRGHQAILKQARERADQLGVPSVAVVFEPQPREYFARSKTGLLPAPARLTKFKEKILALAPFVDGVQVLKFNAQLSSQSPEQFVQHWLLDQLGIQHLVVGDDFRFGAKRAGDYALLERMGEQHGFSVERTRQVCIRVAGFHQPGCAKRWPKTIWDWPKPCWDDRIACEGTSIVECSWLEPWAFRLRM